ncbi:putative 30S ribosomal subunit protein S8 [Candidatus Hodgkinia cicadicola Dsem]|nr:putative 30S ribosomal subunit protein S8 [Candidatus Hodgkinia cicadicola Dsem]
MIADPVAAMLSHIYNSVRARKRLIRLPYSKFKLAILTAIRACGYLERVSVLRHSRHVAELVAELAYVAGEPILKKLTQISKPGRRVYWSRAQALACSRRRLGVCLLSTNLGVITTLASPPVGGEAICRLV